MFLFIYLFIYLFFFFLKIWLKNTANDKYGILQKFGERFFWGPKMVFFKWKNLEDTLNIILNL